MKISGLLPTRLQRNWFNPQKKECTTFEGLCLRVNPWITRVSSPSSALLMEGSRGSWSPEQTFTAIGVCVRGNVWSDLCTHPSAVLTVSCSCRTHKLNNCLGSRLQQVIPVINQSTSDIKGLEIAHNPAETGAIGQSESGRVCFSCYCACFDLASGSERPSATKQILSGSCGVPFEAEAASQSSRDVLVFFLEFN